MKKINLIASIFVVLIMTACDKENKNNENVEKYPKIEKESDAKELAKAVRKSLEAVDKLISNNFPSPTTVNGTLSGSVIVRGTKVHTYLPSTNYTSDDSQFSSLEFSSFSNNSNLQIVSGSGSYSYHYDYASRGGASSTHTNVYYKLFSCKFIFTYNSVKYGGTVSIDYSTSSGTKGKGYSAKVTMNDTGKEFSIMGYD